MGSTKQESKFYLGDFGALLPFLVMIAALIYMAFQGTLSSSAAGAGAFFGFVAAFFLMKDKKEFAEVATRGFSSSMLAQMIMAFLLAGTVAKLMDVGGLVKALVWFATNLGIDGKFIPIVVFLTGAIISSATGTSGGTMTTTTPILLPLAVALGCDVNVVAGAILCGAMFGDNIAPVSDTTIASALTQETEVYDVVKSRLKYAFVAAAIAIVCFAYVGIKTTTPIQVDPAAMEGANPMALCLLLIPVLVVILMRMKKGLVYSMIVASLVGLVMSLVLGLISIDQIFSGGGVVASGFQGMMSIFPFFYFAYVLNEVFIIGGIFDKIHAKAMKYATTPRRAEIICGLMTCLGIFFISSPTVNIVTVGPMVRKIAKEQNIARERSANILDGFSSGLGGTLPYSATTLFPLGLIVATGLVPEDYSVMSYVPYSFHCWALLLVFWTSILTGWGRKLEKQPLKKEEGNG